MSPLFLKITFKAYPTIFTMAFATVFVAGWSISTLTTHPDARVSKASRKSLFRGDLKKESRDYIEKV